MKKKSKSKSKSQHNSKEDSKPMQEEEKCCQVCRGVLKQQSRLILKCQQCKKMTHIQCYNSDFDLSKPFTCDMCAYKKRKGPCLICHQNADIEMLKVIDNSFGFVHVQCAILSSNIQVESYSKLHFIKKQTVDKQPTTKQECCGMVSPGTTLQCVVCPTKVHFRCVIVQLGESYNYYLTSKWLDKCERYEFLLSYALIKKKSGLKPLIEQPLKSKENQILVCNKHSNDYPWCPCDNTAISNQQTNPSYACQTCNRYYHQPCSGLPPLSQDDFICQGCTENDIFKKQLKLHELIGEISKVQKLEKWNDSTFRFLNALPYKYSTLLQKRINEPNNFKLIQNYLARKYISKIFQKLSTDVKVSKKVIQILLYLKFGDKWRQKQQKLQKKHQEAFKIVQQLSDLQKIGFDAQTIQKIKQILKQMKPKQNKSKQIQPLKQSLRKFISNWKNMQNGVENCSIEQLANSIKQVQIKYTNALSEISEQDKNFQQKFNNSLKDQIFRALITSKVSLQTIIAIFKKYSRIIYYQKKKIQINEDQYAQINTQNYENIPKEDKQIYKWLMLRIKQASSLINIKFQSIRKEELVKKYQNCVKNGNKNMRVLVKIQKELINEGVCTIGDQNMLSWALSYHKLNIIQANVIKRKMLKICQIKDYAITQQNYKDIFRIHNFLKTNLHLLTQTQKLLIESYLGKIQFLQSVLQKGEPFHASIGQQHVYLNGQRYNQQKPSILFLKLFQTFQKWDERLLSIQTMISEIVDKCVKKNVKFDKIEITQKLRNFGRTLLQSLKTHLEDGRKMNILLLRKIVKMIKYLGLQLQFSQFIQKLQEVRKWAQIFVAPQLPPKNIQSYLEKADKMQNLIKILDAKISTADEIQRVNLVTEKYKLSLLRQWCKITQKISLLAKSKPTINAIQTLKNFLDKSTYPQNNLYTKITELQIQSKAINKEVAKFLQKPKLPQHLDFHEQLKFISYKMTLQEGHSIKNLLQKCNLDVCVENQQLQTQIKQFQSFPATLGQFAQKKTLAQLNSLRRKLMDSCFKPDKLEQYEKLLRKIYVLKCLNFDGPITRQQYYQLLSVGGVASLQFQSKTSNLLKAYKTIERAETQLLNPLKRRNFSNLIPWAQQRYKQIKEDLKLDQNQLNKLEKARVNNLRVRDQYVVVRNRKYELQKYRQLQSELLSSIFNNRDIISQIATLRLQLLNIVKKVQDILPYSQANGFPLSNQNIFRREKNILQAYLNIGIKHPVMEKFEQDCRNYRKAEQLRLELSLQNYRTYSDTCSRMSDLGARVPEFLNSRKDQFFKMVLQVIQNPEPRMQLYQIFISEGLELRRLDAPQKDKIFSMVISIYQKIQYFSKNEAEENEEEENQQDQQDEDEQDEINQDEQDEQEDEEQIDESNMQDQSDFQQSDQNQSPEDQQGDQNKQNGNNQIVLDSD